MPYIQNLPIICSTRLTLCIESAACRCERKIGNGKFVSTCAEVPWPQYELINPPACLSEKKEPCIISVKFPRRRSQSKEDAVA